MAPLILISPTCAALTATLKKIPTTAMKRQCRINFLSEPNLTKAAATAKETYSAFVIAVTRATATRERHAVGAELASGNFHRAELSAFLAGSCCALVAQVGNL